MIGTEGSRYHSKLKYSYNYNVMHAFVFRVSKILIYIHFTHIFNIWYTFLFGQYTRRYTVHSIFVKTCVQLKTYKYVKKIMEFAFYIIYNIWTLIALYQRFYIVISRYLTETEITFCQTKLIWTKEYWNK